MNNCSICQKKIKGDWHQSTTTWRYMHAICSRAENEFKEIKKVYVKTEKVSGAWTRNANVEREHFSDDLLQPKKKTGEINERFVKAYGTKELQKQWKMSDKEIREKAK